jgi:catechol 2,3-dioxygenase-like lactoylglutathione lyase family enzyme
MSSKIIPILRIFDYRKMVEFYVEWLGFAIDWEHRFNDNAPVYLSVTKGDITLHLTEHHGDGCPGARLRIITTNIVEYQKQLTDKQYKYNKPGLKEDWNGEPCVTVLDPFGNQLTFVEAKQ